jgi:PAS domain-containing protein
MVDAEGRVVFVNEPAERLIGLRHDDTGELPLANLAEFYAPLDEDGAPMPFDQLPIRVALRERRPKQGTLFIHDAEGTAHHITTTAIPLDGQGGTLLGAMAIFWETDRT